MAAQEAIKLSAADDLHRRIFGFVPQRLGTSYERLAAVVLAGFGWEEVKHETRLRPEGRRAAQRLDVTATHPDGQVQRLLVECKDWNREVGKGTMDALVGVRNQAGFDAAMAVTTIGFTSGAVDVAVDENIAIVLLREVRDDERFVMGFSIEIAPCVPDWSNVQFLAGQGADVSSGQTGAMSTDDRLLFADGTPAETLAEIFEGQSAGLQEGVFDREVKFQSGRLAPVSDGETVPIVGVKWTETVSKSSPYKLAEYEDGMPCLVVEQINADGEPEGTRLVVDRHLFAWRIAHDGSVHSTGPLA